LRWQLLCEVGRSDRQVRELVDIVGQPQNLVSYHLGRLRKAGLVSMRRSSADGRDAYYRAELDACGQALRAVGSALNPGLIAGMKVTPAGRRAKSRRHLKVLFLCTGNSARSQMAEAFLAHLAPDIEAHSAGSHPKALHANAIRAMAERGMDISGQRSKNLSEFRRRRFDLVVTLCDKVREICPEFPGDPEPVHWSMADPGTAADTDTESYPAFLRTAGEIDWRVRYLLARLEQTEEEDHG